MYVPSQTLAAAIAAGNPQRILLEFTGGTSFSNERISASQGVKLSSDFVSETDLTIGLCPSAEIQFSLLNADHELDDFGFGTFTAWLGARITNGTPAQDAKTKYFTEKGVSNLYEFAPLGTFKADRPDVANQTVISVTANDMMTLFDVDMPDKTTLGLTYPTTIGTILTAMCTHLSVTQKSTTFTNSTLAVSKEPDDFKDATMREVLGWIAEAAGCNARFTRDGKLELAWFSAAGTVYDEHNYAEFSATWYTVQTLDGLHIRNSRNNAEYKTDTTDSNPYLIQDNPFLTTGSSGTASTAATGIYQKLSAIPGFSPVNTTLFSNWTLEPGDVVTVVSGSDEYTVPIYSTEIDWNGDSKMAVQSTGNKEREPLPAMQRRSYGSSRRMTQAEEQIQITADRIVLMDTAGHVYGLINGDETGLTIEAEHIQINGNLTLNGMLTVIGDKSWVIADCADIRSLTVGGDGQYPGSLECVSTANFTGSATNISHLYSADIQWRTGPSTSNSAGTAVISFGTATVSGSSVSIPYTMLNGTTSTLNFNYAGAGSMTLSGANGTYSSASQAASALQMSGVASGNISSCFTQNRITSNGYYIFVMTSGTGLKKGYYFNVDVQ